MTKILVTGAAGFIGSNFCVYIAENIPEYSIVALDALTYAGNLANLKRINQNERFTFVKGSINDDVLIQDLLRQHSISTIVHFAAESHVDRSIESPNIFLETNILGTHNLLVQAKHFWIDEKFAPSDHRFHHISTDEVYGSLNHSDPAFTETTPYAPNSPYASSKASSDFIVRAYQHTYGLNTTVSNCSNNYGPYHFPEKLIPLIIINCFRGKALPVYGKGDNVRDWLHVSDHARAIHSILEKGSSGETYNVGGNCEKTNLEIVHTICSQIDSKFKQNSELASQYPDCPSASDTTCDSLITFVNDRAGHDFRYAINADKIKNELSFEPAVSFEDGISSTIDWYLNNQDWWSGILDGSYRKVLSL